MSTTAEPEPSSRVLHRRPWPFHHCPSCGHEEFEVSCRSGNVVFSCQGCSRDWRFVLGYLQELPVQPAGVVAARVIDGRPAPLPTVGQG